MCWSTKSTECQPKASTEHSFHILILLLPDFQLKDANMAKHSIGSIQALWISKCVGQPSQPNVNQKSTRTTHSTGYILLLPDSCQKE